MTPAEALARIAAHCDELETDAHPGRLVAQVRAVLAEVTPEAGDGTVIDALAETIARLTVERDRALADPRRLAGGALDRDQARAVLSENWVMTDGNRYLDAHPVPGALEGILDRLARCVRPVAGVTLTPEEAADAAGTLRAQLMRSAMTQSDKDRLNALKARLEATR